MSFSLIDAQYLPDDDHLDKESSIETLKEGLGFLLSRYLENKSQLVASKIVVQLEMMLKHSDSSDFPSDRCALYRLIRYWRVKSA